MAGICAAGSAALGFWAFVPPTIIVPSAAVPVAPREAAATALPPLASFAPVWSVNLRRDLGTASPRASAAPLQVKLAGTIMDPRRPLALLAGPDGRTELKAIGESAHGARVLRIQPYAVELSYQGRTLTLRQERPVAP